MARMVFSSAALAALAAASTPAARATNARTLNPATEESLSETGRKISCGGVLETDRGSSSGNQRLHLRLLVERDRHRRRIGCEQPVAHLQLLDRELRARLHLVLVAVRILELDDAALGVDADDRHRRLDGARDGPGRRLAGACPRGADRDRRLDEGRARRLVLEQDSFLHVDVDLVPGGNLVEPLHGSRNVDRLAATVLELHRQLARGGVHREHGGGQFLRTGGRGLAGRAGRLYLDGWLAGRLRRGARDNEERYRYEE